MTVPTTMLWSAVCKDCVREGSDDAAFFYPERWLKRVSDRGQSRSDRCAKHRGEHRRDAAQLAAPYIDIDTIGLAQSIDGELRGPLGALGALPPEHSAKPVRSRLEPDKFTMTDADVTRLLRALDTCQVALVVAGTGSGKSKFLPYRLLMPPDGVGSLADRGPIVITEPRKRAAQENAEFIGNVLHGTGVGPGTDIGCRVKGDVRIDNDCSLSFVTDGSLINWIRDGTFMRFGTIVVDEAHERSTNIDVILGYLRNNLRRLPQMRLIIISATIDQAFFQSYFELAGLQVFVLECEGAKTHGYAVLWPDDHAPRWMNDDELDVPTELTEETLRYGRLRLPPEPMDFSRGALPRTITRVVDQVKEIVAGTEDGDVLAFLPTKDALNTAHQLTREWLPSVAGTRPHRVLRLIASDYDDERREGCADPRPGVRRVMFATNIAETSLTINGVRFVVDSGLTAQGEWDVGSLDSTVKTQAHSIDGLRQRWGRVGRADDGWVFPLYTRAQFNDGATFPPHTPPEATRANLEQFVLTALAAGVPDPLAYTWPAEFADTDVDSETARRKELFRAELERAWRALQQSGAVAEGDLTKLGQEIHAYGGNAAEAGAMILADHLACAIEMATALPLMIDREILGNLMAFNRNWPEHDRHRARRLHLAMASGCEDELELALKIYALWERAGGLEQREGEGDHRRQEWCNTWSIKHETLLEARQRRTVTIKALNAGVKWTKPRSIALELVPRLRAVLTRTMPDAVFLREGELWRTEASPDVGATRSTPITPSPRQAVAMKRHRTKDTLWISSLVAVPEWVLGSTDEPLAFAEHIALAGGRHPTLEEHGALHDWVPGHVYEVEVMRDDAGELLARMVSSLGSADDWVPPSGAEASWGRASAALDDQAAEDADDPEDASADDDREGDEVTTAVQAGGSSALTQGELGVFLGEDDQEYRDPFFGQTLDDELSEPDDDGVVANPPINPAWQMPSSASRDEGASHRMPSARIALSNESEVVLGRARIVVLAHEGIGKNSTVRAFRLAEDSPPAGRRVLCVREHVTGWGGRSDFLTLIDRHSGVEYALSLDGAQLGEFLAAPLLVPDSVILVPSPIHTIEQAVLEGVMDRISSAGEEVSGGYLLPARIRRGDSLCVEIDMGDGGSLLFSVRDGDLNSVPNRADGAPAIVRVGWQDAWVNVEAPAGVPIDDALVLYEEGTLRCKARMPAAKRDQLSELSSNRRWREKVLELWRRSHRIRVLQVQAANAERQAAFNAAVLDRIGQFVGRVLRLRVNSSTRERLFLEGPEGVTVIVDRQCIGPEGMVAPERWMSPGYEPMVTITSAEPFRGSIQLRGEISAGPPMAEQLDSLFTSERLVNATVLSVLPRGDVEIELPDRLKAHVKVSTLAGLRDQFTPGRTVSVHVQSARFAHNALQIEAVPLAAAPASSAPPRPQPASPKSSSEPAAEPRPVPTSPSVSVAAKLRIILASALFLGGMLLAISTGLFITLHLYEAWRLEAIGWMWDRGNLAYARRIGEGRYASVWWEGWAVLGSLSAAVLFVLSAFLMRRGSLVRVGVAFSIRLAAIALVFATCLFIASFRIDSWNAEIVRWSWRRGEYGLAGHLDEGRFLDVAWEGWAAIGFFAAWIMHQTSRALLRRQRRS